MKGDLNETLCKEGPDAVSERMAKARPYEEMRNGGPGEGAKKSNGGSKSGSGANGHGATSTIQPIELTYFDECASAAPKRWLIKGVAAREEISHWFGPPGAGKSALITDLAVHDASGEQDWRGYRIKESVGWVYFALERGRLTKRRLHAYSQLGYEDLPIAVADKVINMMEPKCVDLISATIRAAEDRFGIGVGGIVIDTVSKAIAAGGGDEDKARDQNIVRANMRRLLERCAIHIALIGHTGKDETRGARGSNAQQGDDDVQVQIWNGDLKTAEVIKANDQATGPLTAFSLDLRKLGEDEDGDPITTTIVSCQVFETPTKKTTLSKNQETMFALLHDARPDGLTTDRWNELAREAGLGRRRADLHDFRTALKKKKLVREHMRVWHVVQ